MYIKYFKMNICSDVQSGTLVNGHFRSEEHAASTLNPLNAELNPIYHLLILLGDLTFTGPCILSIFQYISNKMQRYTVYLYLETALHISGGTSTHHQERIQLYLQHLVFVTPLLLSSAIVEELEPVSVCCW
jgi:hypothetical protein